MITFNLYRCNECGNVKMLKAEPLGTCAIVTQVLDHELSGIFASRTTHPASCGGYYEEVEVVLSIFPTPYPQYKIRENPPTSR